MGRAYKGNIFILLGRLFATNQVDIFIMGIRRNEIKRVIDKIFLFKVSFVM